MNGECPSKPAADGDLAAPYDRTAVSTPVTVGERGRTGCGGRPA